MAGLQKVGHLGVLKQFSDIRSRQRQMQHIFPVLGLRTPTEVRSHPRLGASWEGFALEHAISLLNAERDAYFWGTHGGAELDLLITRGGAKIGFEFKFTESPATTKSMRVAMTDLKLKRLFVVYPGTRRFELDDDIIALPLAGLLAEAASL